MKSKFKPMGKYMSVRPLEDQDEEENQSNFDFSVVDARRKTPDRFMLVEVLENSDYLLDDYDSPVAACEVGEILVAEATQVFEVNMPNGEKAYALSPQYVIGKLEDA